MPLSAAQLTTDMLAAAKTTAGQQWTEIKTAVTFEFRILAQRLVQIVKLRSSGEIDDETARLFFSIAHNNCIGAIAMTTALVAIAVKRIVDSALNVAKEAVNSAIGFALV